MTNQYNNISDELRALIPVLSPNQSVNFRLIGYYTATVVDDANAASRQVTKQASWSLPPRDRIYDGAKKRYVDIGYVTGITTQNQRGQYVEVPTFGSIDLAEGIRVTGRPEDKDLYEFMMLTNRNKDSVNPDKVEPENGFIFEMIKPEATAKEKRELRDKVLQASAIIREATPEEFDLLVQRLGIPRVDGIGRNYDAEELTVFLDEIADKDPRRVINASTEETGVKLKNIREGVTHKIIEFNDEQNAWLWGDSKQVITTLLPNSDPEAGLLTFFLDNPKADAIFPKLVKANTAANEKRANSKKK